MSVRKLIKCLLSGIYKMDRASESGLSTLEWILLVAAVGGLATIGVIVVRGAVDETDDRTQDQTQLAGETGALRTVQGRVNEIMRELRSISRFGTDLDRFKTCLGEPVGGDQAYIGDKLGALQEEHSELYSFHPVSIDWDTAYNKFRVLRDGDPQVVWCRVRNKLTGVCASIADETPVSDPPNDGYRDTNKYRLGTFSVNPRQPNTIPSHTHSYPLSNTFCKGRV